MIFVLLVLVISPILIVIYAGWNGQKLPDLTPNNYDSKSNKKSKVVVCCGDSITHGRIGYDWVSELANKNPNNIFVNAGINGDLAWNLNERLNDVIKCKPSIITILIGTNDAMGSQTKKLGNDYIKMNKLPESPSVEWFKENYEKILSELIKHTDAKIYLITLPWVGENANSNILKIIESQNKIIKELGRKYDLELIPFFEKIKVVLNEKFQGRLTDQYRYEINYKRMFRIARAIILHYVFRYSWNDISKKYGLYTLCDFIHLNDNSGLILTKLVQEKLDLIN